PPVPTLLPYPALLRSLRPSPALPGAMTCVRPKAAIYPNGRFSMKAIIRAALSAALALAMLCGCAALAEGEIQIVPAGAQAVEIRSEAHTSELQSRADL